MYFQLAIILFALMCKALTLPTVRFCLIRRALFRFSSVIRTTETVAAQHYTTKISTPIMLRIWPFLKAKWEWWAYNEISYSRG